MITNFLDTHCDMIFKFPSFIFQGDYIKHPVLYELSHKYGFPDNFPESSLPNRLEEIKEVIRREIRKELKVSERVILLYNNNFRRLLRMIQLLNLPVHI